MGRGAGSGGRGRVPIRISEGIAGRFAGAPREHIALVPGVVVRPEREYEIDSKRLGRQRVVGSTNLDTGEITLAKGATGATARHELGHTVFELGLTTGQRSVIEREYSRSRRQIIGGGRFEDLSYTERFRLGNGKWVSGYGFMNSRESFSEAYMMWTNPVTGRYRERVSRVAPGMAAVLAETTGIGI